MHNSLFLDDVSLEKLINYYVRTCYFPGLIKHAQIVIFCCVNLTHQIGGLIYCIENSEFNYYQDCTVCMYVCICI